MTKVCPKCPQNGPQPIENFAIKSGARRQSECKECKRRYNTSHYQRNKSTYIARADARESDLREWFRELKSTLKCNRCPEDHPATIQFHHTDPATKEVTLGNAISLGWSKSRILEEISKCEVLCANCHFKEHASVAGSPRSLNTS